MEKSIHNNAKPVLHTFFTFDHKLLAIHYTTQKHWSSFTHLFNRSIHIAIPIVPIILINADNQPQAKEPFYVGTGNITWDFTWNGIPLSLAEKDQFTLETETTQYSFTKVAGANILLNRMIGEFTKSPIKRVAHLPMQQKARLQYEYDFLHDLEREKIIEKDGEWDYKQGINSYFACKQRYEEEILAHTKARLEQQRTLAYIVLKTRLTQITYLKLFQRS